jgi:hypothetical protein
MRRFLAIGALVAALGGIRMAANPQVRRPVVHFIQFYNQQDTDLGFLPRAVYSWLLAKRVD